MFIVLFRSSLSSLFPKFNTPLKENADVDLIIYLRRECFSLSASTQEENKHLIVLQQQRQRQPRNESKEKPDISVDRTSEKSSI